MLSKSEKETNLEVLNNFMGYGNPEANIWFIGLDEYEDYGNNRVQDSLNRFDVYKKAFNIAQGSYSLSNEDFKMFESEDKKNAEISPTYDGYMKLYNFISQDKITKAEIGSRKKKLFVSNLYSLARPNVNTGYSNFIKENIFNGDFDLWYVKQWKNVRLKLLRNFIKSHFLDNPKKRFYFVLVLQVIFGRILNHYSHA